VTSLLDEVLEAHGGEERWRAARTIRARIRTGGLLPRTRMPGTKLADARLELDLEGPSGRAGPFPEVGQSGVYDRGAVRIETDDGEVLASRDHPREAFAGVAALRRNLRWDALDSTYFAGYATWNYLTTPLLLTADGVHVGEGERWQEPGVSEPWRRLEVEFPPGFHTHSARQTFYVDPLRLIRRQDYTAEVVGGWARAAHYTEGHREYDGLVFPTTRRVYPRGPGNRSLGRPALVALDISEITVEYSGSR
jgi:hypothetical protein